METPETTETHHGTLPIDPNRKLYGFLLYEEILSATNTDPDTKEPRLDSEGHGIATHESIHRRIRDYCERHFGWNLWEKRGVDKQVAIKATKTLKQFLQFPDVRALGGVHGGKGIGSVRGAFHTTTSRTIDPVSPLEISLAMTTGNSGKNATKEEEKTQNMGTRTITEYGLHMTELSFDRHQAKLNKVRPEDMAQMWEALIYCWEESISGMRGRVRPRVIGVFEYDKPRGGPQGYKLVERVLKVEADIKGSNVNPASYGDYDVSFDLEAIPDDVTLHVWEEGVFWDSQKVSAAAK